MKTLEKSLAVIFMPLKLKDNREYKCEMEIKLDRMSKFNGILTLEQIKQKIISFAESNLENPNIESYCFDEYDSYKTIHLYFNRNLSITIKIYLEQINNNENKISLDNLKESYYNFLCSIEKDYGYESYLPPIYRSIIMSRLITLKENEKEKLFLGKHISFYIGNPYLTRGFSEEQLNNLNKNIKDLFNEIKFDINIGSFSTDPININLVRI